MSLRITEHLSTKTH